MLSKQLFRLGNKVVELWWAMTLEELGRVEEHDGTWVVYWIRDGVKPGVHRHFIAKISDPDYEPWEAGNSHEFFLNWLGLNK